MSRTRPRRGLRALVVAIVLLACLGVVADRVAESVAEKKLATTAAEEAAKYDVRAQKTSVEIGGFGFIPQLVKERFDTITVTMTKPTISSVPADDLTVTMDQVDVPRELITGDGSAKVTVGTADLQAKLSAAALTRLAVRGSGLRDLSLTTADGKLQAKLSVQGVDVTASVKPQIRGGLVSLSVTDLPSDVPEQLKGPINSVLEKGFAIPKLPFGARLKQIAIQNGAIVLTATADKVQLGRT